MRQPERVKLTRIAILHSHLVLDGLDGFRIKLIEIVQPLELEGLLSEMEQRKPATMNRLARRE
jgi:hypothetical protein